MFPRQKRNNPCDSKTESLEVSRSTSNGFVRLFVLIVLCFLLEVNPEA